MLQVVEAFLQFCIASPNPAVLEPVDHPVRRHQWKMNSACIGPLCLRPRVLQESEEWSEMRV